MKASLRAERWSPLSFANETQYTASNVKKRWEQHRETWLKVSARSVWSSFLESKNEGTVEMK